MRTSTAVEIAPIENRLKSRAATPELIGRWFSRSAGYVVLATFGARSSGVPSEDGVRERSTPKFRELSLHFAILYEV